LKVIVHTVDMEVGSGVNLLVKSVKLKRLPSGWTYYKYLYFVNSKEFSIKKIRVLDYVIDALYESTHDVPNCEDCEYNQESEDCYCETRRMMEEDRD